MRIHEWAAKWGVSTHALDELVNTVLYTPPVRHDFSEAGVQSRLRLEAARTGYIRLWRNNVGAGAIVNPRELCDSCQSKAKRMIRWGLANDSKGANDLVKSADLIGIDSRPITLAEVGRPRGRLMSREVKKSTWKYTGTPEEEAQMRWAHIVNAAGGDAKIVTGEGSLL